MKRNLFIITLFLIIVDVRSYVLCYIYFSVIILEPDTLAHDVFNFVSI